MTYCLKRLSDGSYIALNRDYKPLGFARQPLVDYETAPGRFKFKRALRAAQITALSFDGNTSAERIYLYNDGCVPTASAAHWHAYSARLKRLAGYQIMLV
jgi:hypothetical protein